MAQCGRALRGDAGAKARLVELADDGALMGVLQSGAERGVVVVCASAWAERSVRSGGFGPVHFALEASRALSSCARDSAAHVVMRTMADAVARIVAARWSEAGAVFGAIAGHSDRVFAMNVFYYLVPLMKSGPELEQIARSALEQCSVGQIAVDVAIQIFENSGMDVGIFYMGYSGLDHLTAIPALFERVVENASIDRAIKLLYYLDSFDGVDTVFHGKVAAFAADMMSSGQVFAFPKPALIDFVDLLVCVAKKTGPVQPAFLQALSGFCVACCQRSKWVGPNMRQVVSALTIAVSQVFSGLDRSRDAAFAEAVGMLPFVFQCHVASKLLYCTCESPPPDIASWGLFPQEVLRAVCGGPGAPPEEAIEVGRIFLELEYCIPPVAVPGGPELLRALVPKCSGRPSALAWIVGFAQRNVICDQQTRYGAAHQFNIFGYQASVRAGRPIDYLHGHAAFARENGFQAGDSMYDNRFTLCVQELASQGSFIASLTRALPSVADAPDWVHNQFLRYFKYLLSEIILGDTYTTHVPSGPPEGPGSVGDTISKMDAMFARCCGAESKHAVTDMIIAFSLRMTHTVRSERIVRKYLGLVRTAACGMRQESAYLNEFLSRFGEMPIMRNNKIRVDVYHTVFSIVWREDSAFPFDSAFAHVDAALSRARDPESCAAALADLRGILRAAHSPEAYGELLPRIMRHSDALSAFAGHARVVTPYLRFLDELCKDSASHMKLSPSGIGFKKVDTAGRIRFKDSSANAVRLARFVASFAEAAHAPLIASADHKLLSILLNVYSNCLSGDFIDFKITDAFGDPIVPQIMRSSLQTMLALIDAPDQRSRGSCACFIDCFAKSHAEALAVLPPDALRRIFQRAAQWTAQDEIQHHASAAIRSIARFVATSDSPAAKTISSALAAGDAVPQALCALVGAVLRCDDSKPHAEAFFTLAIAFRASVGAALQSLRNERLAAALADILSSARPLLMPSSFAAVHAAMEKLK